MPSKAYETKISTHGIYCIEMQGRGPVHVHEFVEEDDNLWVV